ncbi:hypothetical protein JW948_11150 [bacterium]|nr:hypothetical protein [bacterium]
MKRWTIFLMAVFVQYAFPQGMIVEDTDANVLMQVNDEGAAGSITLPQGTAPPVTTDKLYNSGGTLYWSGSALGNTSGWTDTGSDVVLGTAADNVGIGTPTPGAKLEVAGQIKITGGTPGDNKVLTSDAAGLASWKTHNVPIVAYAQGDYRMQCTSTDPYNPTLLKYVEFSVPGPGVITVTATGYADWESTGGDYYRMSVIKSTVSTGTVSFGNNYFNYLTIDTDKNCADSSDQYSPFVYSRVFTVSSAGTVRYNLWADRVFSSSLVEFGDICMIATYYPTGTGIYSNTAVPDMMREEEIYIPARGNGIDVPPGTVR